MFRSSWFKPAVVVAVLGAAAPAWAFRAAAEVHVSTAAVTNGPMTRRVIATGSLQAVTTVEIGSQVSGMVQSLLVDYNAFVHPATSSRVSIRRTTASASRRLPCTPAWRMAAGPSW